VISGVHLLTNLTLGLGTVVHDYLAREAPASTTSREHAHIVYTERRRLESLLS